MGNCIEHGRMYPTILRHEPSEEYDVLGQSGLLHLGWLGTASASPRATGHVSSERTATIHRTRANILIR